MVKPWRFEQRHPAAQLRSSMTAAIEASRNAVGPVVSMWLATYRELHPHELAGDKEFSRWLEEDYAPVAGGWHY
jgi:hypothetical protein